MPGTVGDGPFEDKPQRTRRVLITLASFSGRATVEGAQRQFRQPDSGLIIECEEDGQAGDVSLRGGHAVQGIASSKQDEITGCEVQLLDGFVAVENRVDALESHVAGVGVPDTRHVLETASPFWRAQEHGNRE